MKLDQRGLNREEATLKGKNRSAGRRIREVSLVAALSGLLLLMGAAPTWAQGTWRPVDMAEPAVDMPAPAAPTFSPNVTAPPVVRFGFYAVFFLSILGSGILLGHIFLGRRGRGGKGAEELLPPLEGVAWEENLVPATIATEGEPAPPEMMDALDHYGAPAPHLPSPSFFTQAVEKASQSAESPSFELEDHIDEEAQRKSLESWLRRATVEDVAVLVLMEEGIRIAQEGRKAEAYDVFDAITRLVPTHVEAWLWKGGMAFHPEESVRCLQRALDLDPDNVRARAGLAWALARLQEAEDSEDEAEER